MILIMVAGTHGKDAEWHSATGEIAQAAKRRGLTVAAEPFVWSTELDGVLGENDVWERAGTALKAYAYVYYAQPLCVVAHSHGGQVAAYASAYGLNIAQLITVSTPVRHDMEDIYEAATINIDSWTHLYDKRFDFWQSLGQLFDGRVAFGREMKWADKNVGLKGVGHSGILRPGVLDYLSV